MRVHSTRLPVVLIIGALALSGTGCSVLNFTTDMHVVATANMDSVRVYQDAGLTSDGVNWGERGMDSVQLALANVEPYHLVRFERDGHLPAVVPVLPSRRNPLKWVDAGLTLAGIGAIVAGIPADQTGLIVGGFFTAFYNAIGLLFPPKMVYGKRLDGPELRPIPTRQEGSLWWICTQSTSPSIPAVTNGPITRTTTPTSRAATITSAVTKTKSSSSTATSTLSAHGPGLPARVPDPVCRRGSKRALLCH